MNDTRAVAGAPADENQIFAERRAKLAALRAAGPTFPNDFVREHEAGDLQARYGELDREALAKAGVEVVLAGRMMLKRVMGKASFATIQDGSGRLQIYINNDVTGVDAHEAFKHWDLGDIVGARGTLFRTKTRPIPGTPRTR